MPGFEQTENEIRYRVREPSEFNPNAFGKGEPFRRKTLKADKPRVFAIIGKLKGKDTTTIQALRFPKEDGWTIPKARAWVKDHPVRSIDMARNEYPRKNDIMETRLFPFEIRSLDDDFKFSGYATVFNVILPFFNEKVLPGSAARTLKSKSANGKSGIVPILLNHDVNRWVGMNDDASENKKGLEVWGSIDSNPNNHDASKTYSLMKMAHERGMPAGLSIGFRVTKESFETIKDTKIRLIQEFDLLEYSITPFPANPKAGVTKVHSLLNQLEQLTDSERTLLIHELGLEPARSLDDIDLYDDSILTELQKAHDILLRR